MKRIWHPYWNWEDYKAGMWKSSCADEAMLDKAVAFTGDALLYGSYMLRVANEWPITCEHNLTDTTQNRRAWIGHAACSLAIGCPEHITRQAWRLLTEQQRIDANLAADRAISVWEDAFESKDSSVRRDVALARIFG